MPRQGRDHCQPEYLEIEVPSTGRGHSRRGCRGEESHHYGRMKQERTRGHVCTNQVSHATVRFENM
jgi:hypothetical protein